MAWNTKYYTIFDGEDGITYTLSIKEEDYAGGSTELQAGSTPITINMPSSDILTPSTGTGAEIQLVSATSLQLIGLYTEDPLKYKVTLNNSTIDIWSGWLNSETYEEVYSEYADYIVSFTANDGLSLLNDLDYLDSGGNPILKIDSMFNIIKELLVKIGAEGYLSIADTMFLIDESGVKIPSSSGASILHNTYVNTDNYYDELVKPLTCREVLDEILKPLGLVMRYDTIYNALSPELLGWSIFDNNTIAREASMKMYHYTLPTGTFTSSDTLTLSSLKYDLENTLSCNGIGSILSFGNIINNQRVVYSPYSITTVVDAKIDKDTIQTSSSYSSYTTCSDDAGKWIERYYDTATNYTLIHANTKIVEAGTGVVDAASEIRDVDHYVRFPIARAGFGTYTSLLETVINGPEIWGNYNNTLNDFGKWALLVDCEVKFIEDTSCYAPATPSQIDNYYITVQLNIGGKVKNVNLPFEDKAISGKVKENTWYHPVTGSNYEEDEGLIVDLSASELSDVYYGKVKVTVLDNSSLNISTGVTPLRIKNINVKLVRTDTGLYYSDYPSNDIVLDSVVNSSARNDGSDIELIHGSLTTYKGLDKGVLMFSKVANYYFAVDKLDKLLLDDLSAPIYFTVEEWLVNKVMSNFRNPSTVLTNINVKSNQILTNTLAIITDVNQFPALLFMISSYSYDVYKSDIILELTSVIKDDMNVIST